MDTTWRKLYAKTLSNGVVKSFGGPAIAFLSWMLMSADQDGRVYFSTVEVAKLMRVSRQTMRSMIDAFQKNGTISVNATKRGTEAVLENWAKYQSSNQRVTNSQPTSNQQKLFNSSKLNEDFSNNQPTSNQQVTNPTQEPGFPPRTPLYRLREDVCVARTREGHTHTEKKENKYPETTAEVIEGAKSEGIEMTESDARDFLEYNAARGWMLGETPVADWKKLLGKWKKAEKAKAVATKRDRFGPTPFSGDYSTTKKRNAAKNWM